MGSEVSVWISVGHRRFLWWRWDR